MRVAICGTADDLAVSGVEQPKKLVELPALTQTR